MVVCEMKIMNGLGRHLRGDHQAAALIISTCGKRSHLSYILTAKQSHSQAKLSDLGDDQPLIQHRYSCHHHDPRS